ncbi:TraI domain-containing protein [Xenorhabdus koppenhoeferi]|uniref:Integrating conjugative element relaxase, PFL_4751 family n=1 Tax=Xenorhabdus koppenhoeferi TaxID=351659 RepID=A0A1I7J178_9GAMM|nr:TraI domain-containing protein [Xenorhabdus koppenhoeferi]CEE91903.1 conserved hypothetical protein [Xenorhabdus nematophila str. Anatoliense]SFU78933.1 integrating conjugative element relaxase, PFL_4751 family [Xenorhabdus koppenhoeferi]
MKMLKKLLYRNKLSVSGGNKKEKSTPVAPDGYFLPQLSCDLLDIPYRKVYLQQLWENVSLPKSQYEELFLSPLRNCAGRMQNLPAFSQGEFSQSGGLLDLTLLTMVYSVRLAKKRMLPIGGLPEDQANQSSAWNAVVFYSAMLHWVPLMGHFEGEYADQRSWIPGVTIPERAYRFRFKSDNVAIADLRCVLGALMSYTLLPEKSICWLSETPAALHALVNCTMGRQNDISLLIDEAISKLPELPKMDVPSNEAGSSSIVESAPTIQPSIYVDIDLQKTIEKNGLSISTDIQEENTTSIILEPNVFSSEISTLESSKQEILSESMKEVIDDDLQTAMSLLGIETDMVHQDENIELCSLNDISDQQHAVKITYGENKLGYNSLYENNSVEIVKKDVIISETVKLNSQKQNEDQSLKTKFWEWLKKGLKDSEIKFNTADAKIHSVAGFLFLQTPAIFFLFLREHPSLDVDHHTLLSAFESLNVHRIEKKGGKRKYHYVCKIYPIPIIKITEETQKKNKFIRASGYLVKASLIFGTSVPSDSTFVDFTSG